ncbi:MAG: 3-oxoacyl-[acyl-carrier-protein] reductase [Chitinophagaceae bacterium]
MNLLQDKVAIVTGGSRGIGLAIVEKLAANGATVAFTYVSDSSKEKAEALATRLKEQGQSAKAYQSDAADYAAAESFVAEVLKDFGKVDVCVNNAGISIDNLLLRMTSEQWDKVLHTNLTSVFNLTKNVIRPMMKAKGGAIINMSSVIGLHGNAGQSSYAASKAGIVGFTKSIAQELGSRNIRCNAIAPGFIETDMTSYLQEGNLADSYKEKIPLKRFGQAEDIANAVLYLASDMSSYVTGQTLSVCGGMSM